MKIALASPLFPSSIQDALNQVNKFCSEAASNGATLICFPESFVPGYPSDEYKVCRASKTHLQDALAAVIEIAKEKEIAIILPMDWYEGNLFLNVAFVISKAGIVLGYQSKCQLDPSEDKIWAIGKNREMFELDDLKFGITICHEGFRYPETVRWAALRGAAIVFHPHFTGSDFGGNALTDWGANSNPYYEKAMIMRAAENTIFFASVNYATRYQDSATSFIGPEGNCIAFQPYGKPGVLVVDIDLSLATGRLAKRFKPELYK